MSIGLCVCVCVCMGFEGHKLRVFKIEVILLGVCVCMCLCVCVCIGLEGHQRRVFKVEVILLQHFPWLFWCPHDLKRECVYVWV